MNPVQRQKLRVLRASFVVLAALSALGCSKKRYEFRNLPFCASDDVAKVPRLDQAYQILVKYDNGYEMGALRSHSPRSLSPAWDDEVLIAIVACAAPPRSRAPAKQIMEEFDENHVPLLCDAQKSLLHTTLHAQEDQLSRILGHGGYFALPSVAIQCAEGYPVQSETHTLAQALTRLSDIAQAYQRKHGEYPHALSELPAVAVPPGSRDWVLESTSTQMRVLWPGPDGKPGSGDDVELLRQKPGGANMVLTLPGTDYSPSGNYEAFSNSQ